MRSPTAVAACALVLALAGACNLPPYSCNSDDQCVLLGVTGRCAGGPGGAQYCAFADPDCPSRLRFDESAGPAARDCVELPDMTVGPAVADDLAVVVAPDLSAGPPPCSPGAPACEHVDVVPPFALSGDPMPNPAAGDVGLTRESNGYLVLQRRGGSGQPFLFVPNSFDLQRGTVSKIDTRGLREVARYPSVTCFSNKSGSRQMCDGVSGCCAVDDLLRYEARKAGRQIPGLVNVAWSSNGPNGAAVDLDGSALVYQRGFRDGPSLTRIAAERGQCIDRNRDGEIQTSADTNGDGLIQTDCNGNFQPDDIADVKGKACNNALPQEFFGLDDECVLWTTLYSGVQANSRGLALGFTTATGTATDAWTITGTGRVLRTDATTGIIESDGQLANNCFAQALAIDGSGIGWASGHGPFPCYFDSRDLRRTGRARAPSIGLNFSAEQVTVDRDQNVWFSSAVGDEVFRYTPARKDFDALADGRWIRINGLRRGGFGAARGIAADTRSAGTYFVWVTMLSGQVIRLPGSALSSLVAGKADASYDGSSLPSVYVAGNNLIGTGIDVDQNVWTVSGQPPVITRIKVAANGNASSPNTSGMPAGKNKCPAGDICNLSENNQQVGPDVDSDFTGAVLRGTTRSDGVYTWVQSGCTKGGVPAPTQWIHARWDALVPAETSLTVRLRTGETPVPDDTWNPLSGPGSMSPLDLAGILSNERPARYIQIELTLRATKTETPVLRAFGFDYRCP